MIEYVIKSTICLSVSYGFYHFVLQNVKIPIFNRFYLLFSLLFALIVPLIKIQMNLNIGVNPTNYGFSSVTGILLHGEEVTGNPIQLLTFQSLLILIYGLISSILLVRFALNIYKIIRLIQTSKIVHLQKTQIVLVEIKSLPYSFFSYIFVNRSDYEEDRLEKELFIHEQAHCRQFHSIDILTVELIKVILWFNPFIWLYRKAIQLNHEYLADNKVLSNHDLTDYQNTLINLVFRNNSTYLASNFNYSLTKKRLIMMTKNKSKSVTYKIAMVPVLAVLVFYFISCNNESKESKSYENNDVAWYHPILQKHHIEPEGFNNFENVFEMGTENSIDDRIATLKDAVFVIKTAKGGYILIKSPLAVHNLNTNRIDGETGTIEIYASLKDTKPIKAYTLKKFNYQIRNKENTNDSWDAKEID